MTLQPADEGLHTPPDPVPAKWQENLFFVCWDTDQGHGVLVHIQRSPGTGWQEAQLVMSIGGRLASASFTAPFHPNAFPPQLSLRATVPFQRWQLSVEGRGHLDAGPLGFYATRPGGDQEISADLTLESVLPVADLAEGLSAIVTGLRSNATGPQMAPQEHYEQGGTWHGELSFGDRAVTASGLFVRDHSWGVRSEQQRFQAFWTASCLDEGRLFCNAIGIPTGDRVVGVGVVVDQSGVTFTDDVAARFTPQPGLLGYERAGIEFGTKISRSMNTRTLVHVPIYLPQSGPLRYDNNAISTVEMGGQHGFGVIEWADVLTQEQAAQLDPSLTPGDVGP